MSTNEPFLYLDINRYYIIHESITWEGNTGFVVCKQVWDDNHGKGYPICEARARAKEYDDLFHAGNPNWLFYPMVDELCQYLHYEEQQEQHECDTLPEDTIPVTTIFSIEPNFDWNGEYDQIPPFNAVEQVIQAVEEQRRTGIDYNISGPDEKNTRPNWKYSPPPGDWSDSNGSIGFDEEETLFDEWDEEK